MNSLPEQARAARKRGDYKKAISLYDRAIGHAPSVSSLDGRAACYDKLGDHQAALKDAKKIIQLQREDPTGYLRAGKLLIKMGKAPVALEIYTHGMRYIKHVGQGYELLQQAYKDLLSKLSPARSVDPLTMLPRELAEQILEYLSFKQRMNACLVSKSWTQFIRSCPDLWQHLDLSKARGKVRSAFVSRAINTGRQKLTRATFGNLYDFEKALAAIVNCCPLRDLTLDATTANLHEILYAAKYLKQLIFDVETLLVSGEIMRNVLRALAGQLEHFKCLTGSNPAPMASVAMPRLHTLSMTFKSHLPHSLMAFKQFAKSFPALESLTIHNETGSETPITTHEDTIDLKELPLRYLDLKLGMTTAASLALPTTIQTLKLACASVAGARNFWFEESPAGMVPLKFILPCLEVLRLQIPQMVIHNVQHALEVTTQESSESTPASNLHSLTVIGAKLNYLQTSELFKHPRLRELRELGLTRLQSCCDDDVTGIVECLPNLQTLDLSENDITGIGVRKAVQGGTVKDLTLDNCRKLGVDAVEWARRQGVKVHYRMSDGSTGGRKVRH